MKLYATTTSERATKGQGGNEYLDIDIQVKDLEIVLLTCLRVEIENGSFVLKNRITNDIYDSKPVENSKLLKGKNKTKKCYYCGITSQTEEEYEEARENWWSCGRGSCNIDRSIVDKKGKSQKGETREGNCHCGYPCIYGTDYCERHQTP